MVKDVYSIYPSTWGDIQIRKYDKTEINIVAVLPILGNGHYSTDQNRKQALKLGRKIIRFLNGI